MKIAIAGKVDVGLFNAILLAQHIVRDIPGS